MHGATLAILSVIIIVSAVGIALFSASQMKGENPVSSNFNSTRPTAENQTINVETPIDSNQNVYVKITEFNYTSGWNTPVGMAAAIEFNVTIHNLEDRDIDQLMLQVEMLDVNGRRIQAETWFYGPGIIGHGALLESFDGVLHAGEVRTLQGVLMSDWGTLDNAWALGSTTTVVDVKLGDVVLDELKTSSSTIIISK